MDIEIVTTKKKVTKSIVGQMRRSGREALVNGTALGYMINVVKNQTKTVLMLHKGEYSIITAAYQKRPKCFSRNVGNRYWEYYKFETDEECDAMWKAYQLRLDEATTQIYI